MYDEEGYLSVIHCLLALEPLREEIGQIRFAPSSFCSLLKNLCTGKRVPDLTSQLNRLACASEKGPFAIIYQFMSEIEALSYYNSCLSSLISLSSLGVPKILNILPKSKITILKIEWERIDMKQSLEILSNVRAESIVFTNGLIYLALAKDDDGTWTVFDANVTKNLTFNSAIKLITFKNMYPVIAFCTTSSTKYNVTNLHEIADKVDSIISFRATERSILSHIPQETPSINSEQSILADESSLRDMVIDKTPSNETWKCKRCRKNMSRDFYECDKCSSINWDMFYKLKKIETKKPPSMLKAYSSKAVTQKPPEIPEKNPPCSLIQRRFSNQQSSLYESPQKETRFDQRRSSNPTSNSTSEIANYYAPSKVCSKCYGTYAYRCLVCSKQEETVCSLCGSPNLSSASQCWKCRAVLPKQFTRRQKRDFTFGKE